MFILQTVAIDYTNEESDLGSVKIFKSMKDALKERDEIIEELQNEYGFDGKEDVDITNNGLDTSINLNSYGIYEIKIQEVEIEN